MPGRLALVGLGISDEKGIPLAGLEKLKECGKIFAESYTNLLPEGTLGRLEKLAGKEIEVLSRLQVEGEQEILRSALREPTALVVPGDPMIATTHVSLVLAAKKRGIHIVALAHHADDQLETFFLRAARTGCRGYRTDQKRTQFRTGQKFFIKRGFPGT